MDDLLNAVPYPSTLMSRGGHEEELRKVGGLCSSLYSEITNLQSSIALFDHAIFVTGEIRNRSRDRSQTNTEQERDERLTRNWPFMAAREALGALYNFHWALKELSILAGDPRIAVKLVSANEISKAFDEFERTFNKALLARHAASHRSEIKGNPERNAHKAALSSGFIHKPKGAAVNMSDCLIDRTYTGTRKGEILKFDVTWESYAAALKIYTTVNAAVAKEDVWPHFAG
ncbi:MAG TPA: hypothetical protein VGN80_07505 [Devosiaceae bacterium]|jgi:hypothetical protein|nr:hypothetical protein [Devosiaceae bacterium]